MTQKILILLFLLLSRVTIVSVHAQYTIGIFNTTSPFNFTITPQTNILNHQAANTYNPQSGNAGKSTMWLEFGDGGFTTYPTTDRSLRNSYINPNYGTQKSSLLVVNNLYDSSILTTSKIFTQLWGTNMTGTSLAQSDNLGTTVNGNNTILPSANLLNFNTGNDIKITSNVYDLVAKDTMCMAITYKLAEGLIAADSTGELNKEFFIAILYKNDAFNTFNATQILKSNTQFKSFRPHHNESLIASPSSILNSLNTTVYNQLFNSTHETNYTNCEIIKIGDKRTYEQNVFLSMFVKSALASGSSTSLKVVLMQQSGSSFSQLAQYETSKMSFRNSHDPNYITQYPICMNLPKIARTFKYHIHFQNTGAGNAGKVTVTAHLPQGIIIDNNSIQLGSCMYADNSQMNIDPPVFNPANNTVVFTIYKSSGTDLLGTASAANAFVNPVTMGDIYFTANGTTATPNILHASADIVFKNASPPFTDQPIVTTNISRSWYSNCIDTTYCTCIMPADTTHQSPPKPEPTICKHCGNCTEWLGICWWWYFIAAGGVSAFLILLKSRKNNKKF